MPDTGEPHLLAVDLGLRTGLAIYRPDGRLLSYRSKHFGTLRQLRRGIGTILSELPPVGWIWAEGGGEIAEAWSKHAASRGVAFHQIHAADWRSGVLLPRQQRSGVIAKREAGTLARKVIEWSGASRPRGALRHDAAEAILIGLHGALVIGLLDRFPDL